MNCLLCDLPIEPDDVLLVSGLGVIGECCEHSPRVSVCPCCDCDRLYLVDLSETCPRCNVTRCGSCSDAHDIRECELEQWEANYPLASRGLSEEDWYNTGR